MISHLSISLMKRHLYSICFLLLLICAIVFADGQERKSSVLYSIGEIESRLDDLESKTDSEVDSELSDLKSRLDEIEANSDYDIKSRIEDLESSSTECEYKLHDFEARLDALLIR